MTQPETPRETLLTACREERICPAGGMLTCWPPPALNEHRSRLSAMRGQCAVSLPPSTLMHWPVR
jgi:hypothetical protein